MGNRAAKDCDRDFPWGSRPPAGVGGDNGDTEDDAWVVSSVPGVEEAVSSGWDVVSTSCCVCCVRRGC